MKRKKWFDKNVLDMKKIKTDKYKMWIKNKSTESYNEHKTIRNAYNKLLK